MAILGEMDEEKDSSIDLSKVKGHPIKAVVH